MHDAEGPLAEKDGLLAANGVPRARATGGLLPGLQLSLDFRREGLGLSLQCLCIGDGFGDVAW